MGYIVDNRVQQTSTTSGTADFTLNGGAVSTGFRAFTDAPNLADGDTLPYLAIDGGDWEVGIGTWTAATQILARTTVQDNSLGTQAKINFSSNPDVSLVQTADSISTIVSFSDGDITLSPDGTGIVKIPDELEINNTNPSLEIKSGTDQHASIHFSENGDRRTVFRWFGNEDQHRWYVLDDGVAYVQSMITLDRVDSTILMWTGGTGGSGSTLALTIGDDQSAQFEAHQLVKEIAAPGTPAAGYGSIYAKTDGKLYFKNDAGAESDLTASGGGLANVVEDTTPEAGGDFDFQTFDLLGDFSNATQNNRTSFISNVTDGNTFVIAKPNGAGTQGGFVASDANPTTNAAFGSFVSNTNGVELVSAAWGAGSEKDLIFRLGSSSAKLTLEASSGNLDFESNSVLASFESGAFIVPEIAAPGTPATGFGAVYAKTDGKLYFKDDAGAEVDLTAGGLSDTPDDDVLYVRENGAWRPFPNTYTRMVLGEAKLYLRLGESSGTTASDEFGLNDGTYVGTPTLGAAGALSEDSDTAVTFDGVDDTVDVPKPADYTNISVEIWCKSSVRAHVLAALRSNAQYAWEIGVGFAAGDCFFNIGDNANQAIGGPALDDDEWHHCVGTYDGTNIRVYVDGVLQDTTAYGGGIPTVTALNISVGSRANYSGAEAWFTGTLDDFSLYDYALSADQVARRYAMGVGTYLATINAATDARIAEQASLDTLRYSSDPYTSRTFRIGYSNYYRMNETSGTAMIDQGQGINGTYVNTPTLDSAGLTKVGSSVQFTRASNEHATLPSSPIPAGSYGFYVSAVVTADSLPVVDTEVEIRTVLSLSNAPRIYLGVDVATIVFKADIYDDTDSVTTLVGDTQILSDTKYHIAINYDGVNAKLYQNGVEVATAALANATKLDPSEPLRIAATRDSGNRQHFDGRIDNITFSQRPWTVAEILQQKLGIDEEPGWFNDAYDVDLEQPKENGFPNRTDSSFTFTNGTRTFEISPVGVSFSFFAGGRKYTKTAAENIVIADTEGLWYFYYDTLGILRATQTFDDEIILSFAYIALVYWDATNNVAITLGEERHSDKMNSLTHLYHHETEKTKYGNGLQPGDIIVNGSGDLDTHAQFSVTGGDIWDEDLKTTLSAKSAPASVPIIYRNGANGDWRKIAATNFMVSTTGTGRAAWNNPDGGGAGVWGLTEVGNNNFLLMHLVATNDLVDDGFFIIMGQAEYTSRGNAEDGAATELFNLALNGLPIAEYKFICTWLVQTGDSKTNTVQSSIEGADADDSPFIDWRFVQAGAAGQTTSQATEGQMLSSTVSGLPTASPAGRWRYVTDETGGAVPCFSDGTNWRRVTDRAVAS